MMAAMREPFRRVRFGLAALGLVLVAGTCGYLLLGFDFLDAVYQTVSTVTTVGFNSPAPVRCRREGVYDPPDPGGRGHGVVHLLGRSRGAHRGPYARPRKETQDGT